MARVSQEHLDSRRRQILEGAARCFARDGFHGTTMQDVLAETGLSAGAVYRYFPSKDAMILEIAHSVLDVVHSAFEEASHSPKPPPPDEILLEVVERLTAHFAHPPQMVLQVWAETFRNPELAALLDTFIDRVVTAWARIVGTYQARGEMAADLPPEHVARTLIACCQGFMVQRALGHGDIAWLRDGLRGLATFRREEEEGEGA
ncbi:TetR/AcrR family transcriptional regulator [Streptomyces sp. 4N509B]|uniref:TetR/AcrR family transcriptional regulator n=1 Tax=Streptomyces sp. 4N509B TaxID=3457413 RepID=UPI003FD4B272